MAESRTSRGVNAAFGVLFLGLAATIAVLVELHDAGTIAVVVVIGLLGADALHAAVANRRSLMSRIGPLP